MWRPLSAVLKKNRFYCSSIVQQEMKLTLQSLVDFSCFYVVTEKLQTARYSSARSHQTINSPSKWVSVVDFCFYFHFLWADAKCPVYLNMIKINNTFQYNIKIAVQFSYRYSGTACILFVAVLIRENRLSLNVFLSDVISHVFSSDVFSLVQIMDDGRGVHELWNQQLQQFYGVRYETSVAITQRFPTPSSLMEVSYS